jgi:hypothetical protein
VATTDLHTSHRMSAASWSFLSFAGHLGEDHFLCFLASRGPDEGEAFQRIHAQIHCAAVALIATNYESAPMPPPVGGRASPVDARTADVALCALLLYG